MTKQMSNQTRKGLYNIYIEGKMHNMNKKKVFTFTSKHLHAQKRTFWTLFALQCFVWI